RTGATSGLAYCTFAIDSHSGQRSNRAEQHVWARRLGLVSRPSLCSLRFSAMLPLPFLPCFQPLRFVPIVQGDRTWSLVSKLPRIPTGSRVEHWACEQMVLVPHEFQPAFLAKLGGLGHALRGHGDYRGWGCCWFRFWFCL